MRRFVFITITVFSLATAAFSAGGVALAAPSGPSSAADAITQLQSQGYRVITNRVGNAPLSECAVANITPGRDVTEWTVMGSDDAKERVSYTTVYLTAQC